MNNFNSDLFLQKIYSGCFYAKHNFAAEANFVTQCFSQTLFSLDPL